jgi:peptidyl-prolyl cis-trans isomerase A (cyclophilin A)
MRSVLLILCLAAAAGCGGDPCGGDPPPPQLPAGHVLLNADSPELKVVPPDSFDVLFRTTKGDVTARLYREWAPMGVFRFYNLVRHGFYDESRFFRVLPGFVAQFGASGIPEVDQLWHRRPMPDDPRRVSNRAGTLTYAKLDTDSRTTQLFFNYADNVALDERGFTPIGRVVEGMGALYMLHGGYGDAPPGGRGPAFACILTHGNRYLSRKYSNLDYIRAAEIIRQY